MQSKHRTLILGGAGFIGSNLAEHFYKMGSEVTVIDGLLENTGGQKKNLRNLEGKIRIYYKKIEEEQNLQELIAESDLIIDCMAWTSHRAGMENPFYDLELNCKSHLHLIRSIKETRNKNIIYLSSRGIYGKAEETLIHEKTPPNPVDIQGIHKLTTEGYFNIYSKKYNFNVVALRIPNCFGKNQPITGDDIGLVGSFIRDALLGNEIEVYGSERRRQLLFVGDLVKIISLVAQKDWRGFVPVNVSGCSITISSLAEKIIEISGRGKISYKEMTQTIKDTDVSDAVMDDSILRRSIGRVQLKGIDDALSETISYFRENLG